MNTEKPQTDDEKKSNPKPPKLNRPPPSEVGMWATNSPQRAVRKNPDRLEHIVESVNNDGLDEPNQPSQR